LDTHTDAHNTTRSGFNTDNGPEEHAVEFIALMLNHIAKEDGIEGLQGHSWVTMVVEHAQRVGITNASEEMLIERFQNEGKIRLVRDMARCDTGIPHNQLQGKHVTSATFLGNEYIPVS